MFNQELGRCRKKMHKRCASIVLPHKDWCGTTVQTNAFVGNRGTISPTNGCNPEMAEKKITFTAQLPVATFLGGRHYSNISGAYFFRCEPAVKNSANGKFWRFPKATQKSASTLTQHHKLYQIKTPWPCLFGGVCCFFEIWNEHIKPRNANL